MCNKILINFRKYRKIAKNLSLGCLYIKKNKKTCNITTILLQGFPWEIFRGGDFHENCMKTKEFPFSPKGLSKMKEFEGLRGGNLSPEGGGISKNFPERGGLSGKPCIVMWILYHPSFSKKLLHPYMANLYEVDSQAPVCCFRRS